MQAEETPGLSVEDAREALVADFDRCGVSGIEIEVYLLPALATFAAAIADEARRPLLDALDEIKHRSQFWGVRPEVAAIIERALGGDAE